MKTKLLNQALERVESWPADAQDQLADIALDIDAALKDVVYEPTDDELEGIDRGLRDAAQGRFATDAEVEAAFAKFRRR
jgi:predicted transcriptional regulator